jgi:hypothetical protein
VDESASLLREVIICAHGTKPVADYLGVRRETIERWTLKKVPKRYHAKLRKLREACGPPGRGQDPEYSYEVSYSVGL